MTKKRLAALWKLEEQRQYPRESTSSQDSPELETDEEGAVESPGEDLSFCKDLR
jgi:hypothetical protein